MKPKFTRAEVIRSLSLSKEYGRISVLKFEDESRVYISDVGWTLKTPAGVEITMKWPEIQMAIDESIEQGRVTQ